MSGPSLQKIFLSNIVSVKYFNKLRVYSGELRTKGIFEILRGFLYILYIKLAGRAPALTIHYPLYTIH